MVVPTLIAALATAQRLVTRQGDAKPLGWARKERCPFLQRCSDCSVSREALEEGSDDKVRLECLAHLTGSNSQESAESLEGGAGTPGVPVTFRLHVATQAAGVRAELVSGARR